MKYLRTIGLLLLVLISNLSFGQSEERLVPSEIKYRTLVNFPLTLPKGYMTFDLAFNSTLINNLFDDEGKRYTVPENKWAKGFSSFLFFSYGITDRLQAEVSTVFYSEKIVGSSQFEYPGAFYSIVQNTEFGIKGIGDVDLGLMYQIIAEDISGSGLITSARMTLPTGTKGIYDYAYTDDFVSWREGTGSGVPSAHLGLRYRKVIFPFSFDVFADYKYGIKGDKIFYSSDVIESRFQGSQYISFTTNFNLQLNDWIALKQSLYFAKIKPEHVIGDEFPNASQIEYTPFVSIQIRNFRITQAFSIPIVGKNISADNRYSIILRYTL